MRGSMTMDCLNSIAPTDEELISYALDDEALPTEANNHLQQCETCQKRLATYKQTNTYLLSHLYRSQCPPSPCELFYIPFLPPVSSVHNRNLLCVVVAMPPKHPGRASTKPKPSTSHFIFHSQAKPNACCLALLPASILKRV